MFIAPMHLESFSLQRSEMYGSTYSSPAHCAPLEHQTMLGCEIYKRLAPPEPDIVGCDFAALRFRSRMFVVGFTADSSKSPMTHIATKL